MTIHEILDALDDSLDKAWELPFSGGRCLIDVDKIRDLIGDIRLNMPTEVKQARIIVEDRRQIIDDAKLESEIIIRKAEERARTILNKDEILKRANEKAAETVHNAQFHAKELKKATNEFVDNILKETEEHIQNNLTSIKNARIAVKKGHK